MSEAAKRLLSDQPTCLSCMRHADGKCTLSGKNIPKKMFCKKHWGGFKVDWSGKAFSMSSATFSLDAEEQLIKFATEEMKRQIDAEITKNANSN